jgi:predicted amidohydrolase YtcJ
MKKFLLSTLAIIAAMGMFAMRDDQTVTQLWHSGHIITLDDQQPLTDSLLIRGDTLVALGTKDALHAMAEDDVVMVDLNDQYVIPGFVDAHSHFPGSGMGLFSADLHSPPLGDIDTLDSLLARLATQRDKTPDGAWVSGFGYDQLALLEQRHPTVRELDAISDRHPIFIMHVSGHMGVANSLALSMIASAEGLTWPEHIMSTGLVEEDDAIPFQRVMFDLDVFDFLSMVNFAQQQYSAAGVTTLQSSNVDKTYINGLKLAQWLGRVEQRIIALPSYETLGKAILEGEEDRAALSNDTLHLSAIKLIADGSIQGYTAYLHQPYFHHPAKTDGYAGYPRIQTADLNAMVLNIVQADQQVAIHANGDASIDAALDAIEFAQQQSGKRPFRPLIIHAQMATQSQLARMATLGVSPSFFGAHTFYWGDIHLNQTLGPARAASISPMQSAQQQGLVFSNHLDTPVVPMSPMLAWWASIERTTQQGEVLGPEERLSRLEGLKALTINAAWQHGLEAQIGSLVAGKKADFVVLSDNPLAPQQDLRKITIERTVVGGKTLYQRQP